MKIETGDDQRLVVSVEILQDDGTWLRIQTSKVRLTAQDGAQLEIKVVPSA